MLTALSFATLCTADYAQPPEGEALGCPLPLTAAPASRERTALGMQLLRVVVPWLAHPALYCRLLAQFMFHSIVNTVGCLEDGSASLGPYHQLFSFFCVFGTVSGWLSLVRRGEREARSGEREWFRCAAACSCDLRTCNNGEAPGRTCGVQTSPLSPLQRFDFPLSSFASP